MKDAQLIRGISCLREDASGYIVCLDANDLSLWLRSDCHPNLNEEQRKIVLEIADCIDFYAIQVVQDEHDSDTL